MATRCNIAILEPKDSQGIYELKSIYSHWDGRPDCVGATLKEHYKDISKIRALIDGGDISSLGAEIEIPEGSEHSFDKPLEGVTVFYSRDRGEEKVKPQSYYLTTKKDLRRYRKNEYLYVYDLEQNEWVII